MFDYKQYLYIVQKRLWVLAAAFFPVVIFVAIYTIKQVPVYKATAVVIIEPDIPRVVDIGGAFDEGRSSTFYNTQYEIIKSSAVVKKAIDIMEPQYKEEFVKRKDPIEAFRRLISVTPVRGSALVNINVDNLNPKMAAEQVNAVARAYMQYNLQDKLLATKDSFTWLSEQIAVLQNKVKLSEMAMLQYNEKENVVSLEKRQGLLEEDLSDLQIKYTTALTKYKELEVTLKEMKELKDGSKKFFRAIPLSYQSNNYIALQSDYNSLVLELAEKSKKYKDKHPDIISLKAKIDNLTSLIETEVNRTIGSIELDYRITKASLDSILASIDAQKLESMRLAQQAIQYGVLKRDAETNAQMYDVLLQRLKEADISGNITANNVRIVDEAKIPEQIKPPLFRNLLRAALAGLVLGIFICFLLDYMDYTVKSGDDVNLRLKEQLLGIIPMIKGGVELTDKEDPDEISRYYRDIKTTIGFYGKEHKLKTMLITSSIRDEGKTTSTVFLAKSFALSDKKVLIIDADIFKPRIAKIFKVDHEVGVSDYVNSNAALDTLIKKTAIPNLHVIPGGLIPPNPGDILSSDRLKSLINSVKDDYDIVLIDSPPLSAALEVSSLGGAVDVVAFVVKAGNTSRAITRKILDVLRAGKGNILGVILTSATRVSGDMSAYYYYKKYYADYGEN
ncbi:MAG: polysaccharide biosynthesis tyrosine autokinase [Nitrospirae bacterium]|nr:polysaccharide biosynthesis tyrosine autokinase [Nitrospirota bacterium]